MYNQEIVYKLGQGKDNNTCYRDKDKCNRFWFEFPAEWRTSLVTERIIGFRSLWIPFAQRLLRFNLRIYIYDDTGEQTEHIGTDILSFVIYIHVGDSFEKIIESMYNELKEQYEGMKEICKWNINEIELNLVNRHSQKYNGLVNCFQIVQVGDFTKKLQFQLTDMNDDAKAIFNCETDTEPSEELLCEGVWTRHRCLLRSSISINNCKNYLGYSQKDHNPIKYYKIQCNENRFYIDLIDAHNNTTIVNLPVDDKEDLVLELVLPPT